MIRTVQGPAPARRGPKATFSRQDAIEIGLRQGLATLTLSSVAKELGVSHTALYREFADTEELRRACAASAVVLMLDQIGEPTGQTWQDMGVGIAGTLWHAIGEFPGLALTLVGEGGADLDDHPCVVRVTRALTRQGLSYARAWVVLDMMLRTVVAARAQAEAIRVDDNPPDSWPEYREAMHLTTTDEEFWCSPDSYEFFSRVIVDGLATSWGL